MKAGPLLMGPYRVEFVGAAVWAGIVDELPPELAGKRVYVVPAESVSVMSVLGQRPDGGSDHLGTIVTPTMVHAREIVRSYGFDDEEAEYALAAIADVLAYAERQRPLLAVEKEQSQ